VPRPTRIGRNGPTERADPCHKASAGASARTAIESVKYGRNQREAPAATFGRLRADPVPNFSPKVCSALIGRMLWFARSVHELGGFAQVDDDR
jgi:hypothetical protein